MSRALWSYQAGSMLGSSPALGADGGCYLGSRSGLIHAVDAAGAGRWTHATQGPVEAGPCVHPEGLVLVGSYDGRLYALREDGQLAWTHEVGAPVMTTPCIDRAGDIWVGDDTGALSRLSVDGTLLERHVLADLLASSPVACLDAVHVASHELIAISGPRVDLQADCVVAPPALGGEGVVYLGSWSGELLAVKGGAIRWRYALGSQIYGGPSIGPDGRVLVAGRGGQVAAVDPQGGRLWQRTLSDGVYGTPAIAEGGVCFVGCNDRHLYALDLATGETRWRERCGRDLRSSPLLCPDGRVLVACWDYELYCFEGGEGGPAASPWPQFHGTPGRLGRSPSQPWRSAMP